MANLVRGLCSDERASVLYSRLCAPLPLLMSCRSVFGESGEVRYRACVPFTFTHCWKEKL